MESLPSDPIILLSYINTKLRDEYPGGIEELCDDMHVNRADIEAVLSEAGFEYSQANNRYW